MLHSLARRYYAATVLPFAADGSIDEAAYRSLLRYYLADARFQPIGGIIANPEAGEIYTLSRAEKRRAIEITLEEVGGRMPIFAGVFELATADCVEAAREAKSLGVDGLFLMPPGGSLDLVTMWNAERYPEYWLDQIKAIDRAVDLPLLMHPVSSPTPQWGIGLPGEATRLICQTVPNVIGWKTTYSYEGLRKIWKILASLERPVAAMGAGGKNFHETLAHDKLEGTISGSWNYALEPMLDHIEAWQAGDIKRARAIWSDEGLEALHDYIYVDYSRLHLRYKIAAWLRGLIPHHRMRAPMPVAKPEEIETLGRLLRGAGIDVISAHAMRQAA